MKKYISRFHYLTQDLPGRTHVEQAAITCTAGANWLQYRCLTKTDEELIEEINQIAEICDEWGATLILTNHYHLLDRVDAQGVHIDDMKADLPTIRKIIGADKTLGASATGTDELLRLQSTGVVDYYVYGPFSSTLANAPDSAAPLGFDGYRRLKKLRISVPVIAAGGIQLDDVEPLLQTGIDGIAVSSAINLVADPAVSVKEFYRKIC